MYIFIHVLIETIILNTYFQTKTTVSTLVVVKYLHDFFEIRNLNSYSRSGQN